MASENFAIRQKHLQHQQQPVRIEIAISTASLLISQWPDKAGICLDKMFEHLD
jgi:hypothetical protein